MMSHRERDKHPEENTTAHRLTSTGDAQANPRREQPQYRVQQLWLFSRMNNMLDPT